MTLDQYVALEKQTLDRFAAHWKEQNRLGPANLWPLEVDSGEWDEQYQVFRELTINGPQE